MSLFVFTMANVIDKLKFWKRSTAIVETPALVSTADNSQGEIARQAAIETARDILRLIPGATNTGPNSFAGINNNLVGPGPHSVYGLDKPYIWFVPQPPTRKPLSLVTTDTLRQLADTYDVLRACINHLKREVATVPFKVVPKDAEDKTPATMRRCQIAQDLFGRRGPVGRSGKFYHHFEGSMLEDVMVIGASAIFHRYTLGEKWLYCDTIDASTIRPILDSWGWQPEEGEPAFEQWIYGVATGRYTARDMTYDGLDAVTWSPYYKSPVEYLVRVINRALYADLWNEGWLVDGNTPSDLIALPEAWSKEDVLSYAQYWDAMLKGNIGNRQGTRFVPGGSQRVGNPSRKDQDFGEFELWLLKRTCSIMGVQPASIGYSGDQYKVTQDESMNATTQFGAGVLLSYRKRQLDDILERAGFSDLEAVDDRGGDDPKAQKLRAELGEVLIRSGQRTINEVRQEAGYEAIEGGDELLVLTTIGPLGETPEPQPSKQDPTDKQDPNASVRADLARWERKAITRVRSKGCGAVPFASEHIPAPVAQSLSEALTSAFTIDEVRAAFRAAREEQD